MLKNGTIQWENQVKKAKRKTSMLTKSMKLSTLNVGEESAMPPNVPQREKEKKAMQVSWSDTESCQSSEKESNVSEECTNFTIFMTSIIEEPLKKEVLSESYESSNSNGDEMSFDTAYETLYKECLSLKQEQVDWKASKNSLINEVKTLKGENKYLLDKIAFLENEHFDVKKMCDQLKSENQVFKNELSLRKEKSHPSSKRLSDLINPGWKPFDKRGLGFVNETTTSSSVKQSLSSLVKEC